MQIAFKECAETLYWLELLESDAYITQKEHDSLKKDCEELRKILSSITKSAKETIARKTPEKSSSTEHPTPNS